MCKMLTRHKMTKCMQTVDLYILHSGKNNRVGMSNKIISQSQQNVQEYF